MKNSKTIISSNLLYFTFLFSISIISCAKEKVSVTPLSSGDCVKTISFANDIFPIMQENCTSCHNTNNPNAGFDLSKYNGVATNVSKILGSMRHDGTSKSMPQGYKIADSLIQKFNCWITQGAKNN